MHVVLENQNGDLADVELMLGRTDATVGDLVDAVRAGDPSGPRNGAGIVLDGRFCHADLALDEIGLHEGARVRLAAAAPPAAPVTPAALELRVVAGLDSGTRIPLPPSGTIIGRDDEDAVAVSDVAVSRRHLRVDPSPGGLRATVTDLGSVNGSWVEGRRIKEPAEVERGTVFEAGDVAFMLAGVSEDRIDVNPQRQAGAGGVVAFNRPPRARRRLPAEALRPPEEVREQTPQRFSMVSAFAPLLLGGVMVILLHNILFALFMLLSPVMVIGSWIESRRQTGSATRGARRAHAEQLARFTTEVVDRAGTVTTFLRESLPDPAEVVRRATDPSPRLWERRPDDDDFLYLSAGLGDRVIRPPLDSRRTPSAAAESVLAANERLRMAPILVDLQHGGVVGIVGPRPATLASARSLMCQAAVLHGPADLQIAVLTEPERSEEWDWAKWLPHARDPARGGDARLLAADPARAAELAGELMERAPADSRFLLAVLDSDGLIQGRGAVGRALLRSDESVSGIVIAESTERLPAICNTVLELEQGTAEAVMRRPQAGESVDPLLVAGLSPTTARECALGLARFEDSDLQVAGGSLPSEVALLPLLGMGEPTPEALARRWRAAAPHTSLEATFALAEDGPFTLDLVLDGPHGLIAGTTGSGKSELLRSLVAALAASHDPARLNLVLIDYKGGSAFAECAELPHTVGLVTDLDEQLGARALRSLEAELRYRERVLGEYRAADLIAYQELARDRAAPALPRLLVIIDEFATLAAELPDFVASLVGIAQRGRSLGVHLLLATQRPSGAVNENIRANANLRICLRVQTPQDSSDVIDSPDAARIGRTQPGRAHVRLGPSELIPIQTALVTGSTAAVPAHPVAVRMFEFAAPDGDVADPQRPEHSDLQRLVAAARDAFASLGAPPPRRPWLPPLAPRVDLEDLLALGPARPLAGERGLVVPLALADDPDAQAQYPVGWNLDAGNLLLYGLGGSGTTTTLQSIALALAGAAGPERVHIYAMDFGAGELAPLAALPHVGAVTATAEHERQRRLLRRVRGELEARRRLDPAARAGEPRIVILLDGYAGFASEHSDLAGDEVRDALARVWADGPEVGIHVAISADRAGAVPGAVASLAQQRLVFRLADLPDYAQFGIHRSDVPRFTPGRAVVGGSGQAVQVARSRERLEAAAGGRAAPGGPPPPDGPPPPGGPPPVGVLPATVPLDAVLTATRVGTEPWFVPIGIGDDRLEPVGFELYPGDHALVAGSPRSGKTTTLLLLAALVARAHPEYALIGVAVRPSKLRDCSELERVVAAAGELPALIEELRASGAPRLLLIDDAEMVPDESRALTNLFADAPPGLHAVLAGRADGLRSLGHWSAGARRSRAGLLLQPDVSTDGGLLGVTLPRRPSPPVRPGCGYLVQGGGIELVQVAQP